MATLFDGNVVDIVVPLLVMIFVFLILYGLLQKSKILGGNQAVDFFVALTVGILTFFTDSAVKFTQFMSVWLLVATIVLIFLIILLSFFAKDGDLGFPDDMDIKNIVFWIGIIILAVGLTYAFGPILTPYAQGADPNRTIFRTLFHPRVAGAIIMVIIIANMAKLLRHTK
jgi:hypothetical protein